MKSFWLFLGFVFSILVFSSCAKKNVLREYLTNDSISMWDMKINTLIELRDTSYNHSYFKSYLFKEDFNCQVFSKLIWDERVAEIIGPKPNILGLCDKWEILNDSTIKVNCVDTFVVKIINRDTIYLFDTLGVKKHEMYRVSKPWNINEESVEIRDKLIESGDYSGNIVY